MYKTDITKPYVEHDDPLSPAGLLTSDWHGYMTIDEFKREYIDCIETYAVMYKFTGCGWYITKAGSLLILPGDVEDNKYWFYCWNNQHMVKAFNQIANATVRQDDR